MSGQPPDKYVNLEAQDRFVSADLLRASYLRHDESLAPGARPFVPFESEDLELGIVSSQVPELARAVSSILSRSLEDAKDTRGGYLPPQAVEPARSSASTASRSTAPCRLPPTVGDSGCA